MENPTHTPAANSGASAIAAEVQPAAGAHRRSTWLLLAVLAVTALAYSGTLRFEFVYDDGAQIVYNPGVQSWRFATRLFTEHVWSSQIYAPAVYYRPLFMLWCLIQYTLFGLNPVGWHLATVAAHLAATACVFQLAKRLLRDEISAAFAAMIFGLHPVHVESVAWISGVADPLMTVFFVSSFLGYLNFRERRPPRAVWMAASLLLYALATLTKEPGIMLPVVIFAYEFLFWDEGVAPGSWAGKTAQVLKKAIFISAPYLVIALLYLAQRFHVLKAMGHARLSLPAIAIPLTWPSLLWFYAHKLAWPVDLSPFYDTPYVAQPDFAHFVLPLLCLAAVGVGFALWVRSLPTTLNSEANGDGVPAKPTALFALIWIVAPLLPVLDIVSLEPREIAHDRYLYLSVAGFALLVAMALRQLRITKTELFGQPAAQVMAAIVIVAAFGIATVQQSVFWANDLLLFYRAVRVAPSSESATNNLANALLERHHDAEGLRLHQQILHADPNYWMSHYNLGNYYANAGRLDEAEQHMFSAARLSPSNPQLFLYLGMIQMKNQHLHESELNIREAIRIWPRGLGAYYVLGLVLEQEGKLAEAAEAFQRELALDRNQPRVQAELAAVEKRLGQKQ